METDAEQLINTSVERERHLPPVRDYTLWALLSLVRDTISRVRTLELAPNGITPRQFAALLTIRGIGPGATPAEVARRLLREPHTVSVLLKRMKEVGLVNETRDLDKKNQTRVSLTRKGEEALARSIGSQSLREIFLAMPDEERYQLQCILEVVLTKAVRELGELDNKQRWDLAGVLGRLRGGSVAESVAPQPSSVDE